MVQEVNGRHSVTLLRRGASSRRFLAATLAFSTFMVLQNAFAGPPFRTDDPEPVDYRHWELYVAAQYQNDAGGVSGTAPHVEVNYGAAPNLQLHLLIPDAYNRPHGGPSLFGAGNIELGLKFRFLQEGKYVPMAGVFPLAEVPTASESRGLSTGRTQLFFPLWFQKSWGPWTSYGGGGYWVNPEKGNSNYWYTGVLLQRDITTWLTVGAEVFHTTPSTIDGEYETGCNAGAIVNITPNHHFICSGGTDIHGSASFFYAAYLWTWGPPERK